MEKYFKDKVFFEELELWDYLLSLRDQTFDLEDGFYFVEYIEQKSPFQLRYDRFIKFESEELLDEALYDFPYPGPRLMIHLCNKKAFLVELDSAFLVASEHIVASKWEPRAYRDVVLEFERSKVKFPTKEEAKTALEKLAELLVVDAKKIAKGSA